MELQFIYVKNQDIQTWEEITIHEYNNITSFIQVEIYDINIINAYKPSNDVRTLDYNP